MRAKTIAALVIAAVFLGLLLATIAEAIPNPPENATANQSQRRVEPTAGARVSAQAGNVTQLIVNDTRITAHWQGYYGTITGDITLDDAKNNTLFDWKLANPNGQIYASNSSTVSWANISCVNLTGAATTTSPTKLNTSILESAFNITSTDADGINETFNWTFSGSFSVGATTIATANNCPLVYLYKSDAPQQTNFREVILTDNNSVVYTSLLENDVTGFNSDALDFEMVVTENQASGTTDYFFFVELT